MARYKTNQQLRDELKQLGELLKAEGVEVSKPSITNKDAYKLYKENFEDAKAFLLVYADILAKTGRPYQVEPSEKLSRLIEVFEKASGCEDVILSVTCTMLAEGIKQATGATETKNPYTVAAMILDAVKDRYKPYYKEFKGAK